MSFLQRLLLSFSITHRNTEAISTKIIGMEKVSTVGKTVQNLLEPFILIKKKATAYFTMQTEMYLKASTKTMKDLDPVYFLIKMMHLEKRLVYGIEKNLSDFVRLPLRPSLFLTIPSSRCFRTSIMTILICTAIVIRCMTC